MGDPSLLEADWYCGDITKEESNDKLKKTPDGAIFVGDASTQARDQLAVQAEGPVCSPTASA